METPHPAPSALQGSVEEFWEGRCYHSPRGMSIVFGDHVPYRGVWMPLPRALASSWLGPCVLGWGAPGTCLTASLTGISWDNFRGARVIALPGSTAYARNHGVFLTDAQVVPLRQWCGPLNHLGWPPGPVLREAAHPGLSGVVWIGSSSPANSPCAHLVGSCWVLLSRLGW